MTDQPFGRSYGSDAPANYERFFVPAIGRPLAQDLVAFARLRPGERVLDVGCGTGVVARLAAEQVGGDGEVAGVDMNPGMLAAAQAATPADASITWHEGQAESMPFPDEAYDVVFCQLCFQFVEDKPRALKEMRRVLAPDGRLVLNLPGPTAPLFATMGKAMARHVSPQAEGFVNHVFSLHDVDEITGLLENAGFKDVTVQTKTKDLHLPPPREFLWQYVHSTPLVGLLGDLDDSGRSALEQDVVAGWRDFADDKRTTYRQRVVEAMAVK